MLHSYLVTTITESNRDHVNSQVIIVCQGLLKVTAWLSNRSVLLLLFLHFYPPPPQSNVIQSLCVPADGLLSPPGFHQITELLPT